MSPGGDKNVLHINTPINTTKEIVCPPTPPESAEPINSKKKIEEEIEKLPKVIRKFTTLKKEIKISLDDFIRYCVAERKPWPTSLICEAWKILDGYAGYVNDLGRFLTGTLENLAKKSNMQSLKNLTSFKEKPFQKETRWQRNRGKGWYMEAKPLPENWKELPEYAYLTHAENDYAKQLFQL